METFAQPRQFVDNPRYERDREVALAKLDLESIDPPIRGIVAGFAELPYCYTLQSCYGHFVHAAAPQPRNLELVPAHDVGALRYRIAYMAFCLENSTRGRRLRAALEQIPAIDPEYVQFGSPDWFWQPHLNAYALQVEPARFATKDEATIDHPEALHVQQVRDRFFARLTELVQALQRELGAA
jgi:hypothetical protein